MDPKAAQTSQNKIKRILVLADFVNHCNLRRSNILKFGVQMSIELVKNIGLFLVFVQPIIQSLEHSSPDIE